MRKTILIAFWVSGFFTFAEDIFGQAIYKWVDEKGTIHFSDNPTSGIFDRDKEPPKEDGLEVLRKSEMANQPKGTVSGGKSTGTGYSSGSGSRSSVGGRSTTTRTGRT